MPIELLKDSQFKYHINYYFQGNTTVWAEQDFCQKKKKNSSDASVLQRSTKNICIYKKIDNNYIQTKSNKLFFFHKNLKKKST